MRYSQAETTNITGNFGTGATVTIDIYDLTDDSLVVDGAECSEIAGTGCFKYLFTPTVNNKTEFLWIMASAGETQQGKIILGGFPDNLGAAISSCAPAGEYNTEMSRLDVPVSSRSSHSAADLWAHGNRTLTAGPKDADIDYLVALTKHKRAIELRDNVWELIVYAADNITPILRKQLTDVDGNNIDDLVAGALAIEEQSSV